MTGIPTYSYGFNEDNDNLNLYFTRAINASLFSIIH